MSVNEKMTAIADAIREKTGKTNALTLDDMATGVKDVYDCAIKKYCPIVSDSGAVLSINPVEGFPLQGLTVYGKTTQNGTPSPSAPIPLVSAGSGGSLNLNVCGSNLANVSALSSSSNISCEVSADTYTVTVTGSSAWGNVAIPLDNSLAGKTVYLKMDSASQTSTTAISCVQVIAYAPSGNVYCAIQKAVPNNSTTIPQDATRITLGFYINNGGTALATDNTATFKGVRLSLGGYTEWQPYEAPQTIPIPTPNGLNGVSGGCDEIDFVRGVRIKRIETAQLSKANTWQWNAGHQAAYTYVKGGVITDNNTQLRCLVACTHYQGTDWAHHGASYGSYQCAFLYGASHIAFYDKDCTSLDAFLAKLGDTVLTVQYVLATPIETPLTAEEMAALANVHINAPTTTIYNDGGTGMTAKYIVDPVAYIGAITNEVITYGGNV